MITCRTWRAPGGSGGSDVRLSKPFFQKSLSLAFLPPLFLFRLKLRCGTVPTSLVAVVMFVADFSPPRPACSGGGEGGSVLLVHVPTCTQELRCAVCLGFRTFGGSAGWRAGSVQLPRPQACAPSSPSTAARVEQAHQAWLPGHLLLIPRQAPREQGGTQWSASGEDPPFSISSLRVSPSSHLSLGPSSLPGSDSKLFPMHFTFLVDSTFLQEGRHISGVWIWAASPPHSAAEMKRSSQNSSLCLPSAGSVRCLRHATRGVSLVVGTPAVEEGVGSAPTALLMGHR